MRPTPKPSPTGHRRQTATRWPLPHRLIPDGSDPAAIAATVHIGRILHDHRPRNHPTGLTPDHHADIPLSDLAAAMECSQATARRAIAAVEAAGSFQIVRSPGRPIRFRHRPDIAQIADHGKAWMPWTNRPQPHRQTANIYALASWSDWNGNLNYTALRKKGGAKALSERAGMTPPRQRTEFAHLPVEGDLRTRTLRWHPRQLCASPEDQAAARRIPKQPPRTQPPPPAPRRPEHTTPAEPRRLLTPSPRPQTPNKNGAFLLHGLTRDCTELKIIPRRQFKSPKIRKAEKRAAQEVTWRVEHRTHPITNPKGLQVVLTWCYTRPANDTCGRNHPGPCGGEAMTLHSQRRTEQAWLAKTQARNEAIAEAWGYTAARTDGLISIFQPPPLAAEPAPPPLDEPSKPSSLEENEAHENNMRRMKTGNPALYQLITRMNATRKETS